MSRDLMVAIRDLGEASGARGFVAIVPGPGGRHEVRTNLRVAVAYEMLKRAIEMMEDTHQLSDGQQQPGEKNDPDDNG